MKEFWTAIQIVFAAVGGWLGWFLGGCDGLLYALLAFVVIDYITGIMCAVVDKRLSSAVGFKQGDVVSITGKTYYDGKSIPSWVLKKNWIVKSVNGNRVVIDKSEDGKNAICSPVKAADLKLVSSKKTVDEIAREVINGKWGNGTERKSKLTAAGYDYNAVQKRVNELMKK